MESTDRRGRVEETVRDRVMEKHRQKVVRDRQRESEIEREIIFLFVLSTAQ